MTAIPPPNPNANDRAACLRKRRYRHVLLAIAQAEKYEAEGAPPLRAYHCRECDGWHLTKMEQGA